MFNKYLMTVVISLTAIINLTGFNYKASSDVEMNIFAINGEDNRQEVYETTSKWQEISRSVAGRVSKEHIKNDGSGFRLSGSPLKAKECPGNRFSDQITVPSCTGFLAKPNILITAAHCMTSENDCSNFNWVFEYALKNGHESAASYTSLTSDRVYQCKKILSRKFNNFGNIDYAIIELDRPVEGRIPLQMGFELPLAKDQAVVNLGHSSGLPLKFKDSGKILRITDDTFALDTDLDIFQGDSGSPVFDEATGNVIAITSHGHADHRHEDGKSCSALRICKPGDNCHPSTSSRISNIKSDSLFNTIFK